MKTKTPMRKMLFGLGILFGLMIIYHLFSSFFENASLKEQGNAPISVSTTKVVFENWQEQINTIGTVRAVNGVEVVAEVDGMIRKIVATSNQSVKAGDLLVQFNTDPDIATLESLQADAKLAEMIYKRSKTQFDFKAVSAQELEINEYDWKTKVALADAQQALIDQKNIRAPFAGKLGIVDLQLGQFVSAGDPLMTIQQLNPLKVYFYVPEQKLTQLAVDQVITINTDAFANQVFTGKITAINPKIDSSTHNVEVEAIIENPEEKILPGMFARVQVVVGEEKQYLTLPQSAVSYNPYGNLVYVLINEEDEEHKKSKKDKKEQEFYVKQKFVEIGPMRGDQVVILKGLNEGDEVVTSGQLKLRNNARVIVNNEVQPSNDANPLITDE
jgi:membrane fusion protein, multidrug efflux system